MFRSQIKDSHGATYKVYIACLILGFALLGILAVTHSAIATLCYLLLVLSSLNYWIGRDVLYPAFVFCVIWLVAATLFLLCPVEIDPLSRNACGLLAFGALCFSFGSVIGNRPLVNGQRPWFAESATNPQPRRLLLLYSCLTVPLFVHDTIRLAGGFSFSQQFIISARDALLASSSPGESLYSNKVVSTAPMISILCAWIFLMEDRSRLIKGIAVAIVFVMCILSTGRSMLLQFIVGWVVIAFCRSRNRSLAAMRRKGAAVGISAVVLLTLITLVTKHETQGQDALQAAGTLTVEYIAGPIAAFDYGVHNVKKMDQRNDPHGPFVEVPFATNVYTFYQNYYIRAGGFGCFLLALLIGVVHGRVFYACTHGNRFALFIMAYLDYALVLSIFTDAYSLLLRHVEVIGYAVLYFGILRKLPRVRFADWGSTQTDHFVAQRAR